MAAEIGRVETATPPPLSAPPPFSPPATAAARTDLDGFPRERVRQNKVSHSTLFYRFFLFLDVKRRRRRRIFPSEETFSRRIKKKIIFQD
jgi:hypothetical protein